MKRIPKSMARAAGCAGLLALAVAAAGSDPSGAGLRAALADIEAGRDTAAAGQLERILEGNPRNLAAWEHLGWCYWRLGRRDDAERLWNRLLLIDPAQPLAYNLLARLAIQENRIEDAQNWFRKSLERSPDQPEILYHLGRTLRWEGRAERSVEVLEPLLRENPDRTDVSLELARANMSRWDFAGALPHWTRLSGVVPANLDYMAYRAICLLHTNRRDEAVELASTVLARQPSQLTALETLANAAEMGPDPADALPYLERWLDALEEGAEREAARIRLIRLHIRLYREQPRVRTLSGAIRHSRDRLEDNPRSVDAHLLLAELLLMEQRFEEAGELFRKTLEEFNPENRRAWKGLFETYAASSRFDEALEALETLSRFNPLNPYLDYYRARLEAARGDFHSAGEALDRLEAAGLRGSVAVILYHGLIESDYFVDALSVRRFREHLEALQEAGFEILSAADLPGLLQPEPDAERPGGFDGSRIRVVIDFDDARVDSMRYATPIARELGVPVSMNVPVGYVERNHPFICSWDELRRHRDTGAWTFGSHYLDGAILAPISPDGRIGRPLPNRVWRQDLGRMESPQERIERLAVESRESRRILERELGASVVVVSYPFGDLGQEDAINTPGAAASVAAAAAREYRVGFLQTEFGHAVSGDNPLFYQRHEMDRWTGGQNVVEHLYRTHPVFLARRLRAEFAALAGKRHEARDTLQQLEETGYPEPLLDPVRDYVHRRMARKFATPGADRLDDTRSILEIRPDKPFIGARGLSFRDNQGRSHWQVYGLAGLHLNPYVSVEGRAGIGNLRQDPSRVGAAGDRLDIDERVRGLSLNLLLPTGAYLTGELMHRDFEAPADEILARSIEGHFRPFYLLDVLLRHEHDIAPAARAAVEDIRYDAFMGLGVYTLKDWWDLSGMAAFYDFSDDNTRDHLMLGSTWLLSEQSGFKLGLRYMYTTSEQESEVYWTPYRLRRYFVEGQFQGSYLRHYYNLRLRFGRGREDPRPERIERRRELEERARRLRFDPGPPGDEEGGWEPVFGFMASTRLRLGEHWTLNGEISYNRVPRYNELHLLGGIVYSF